jgi:hypothetical protein
MSVFVFTIRVQTTTGQALVSTRNLALRDRSREHARWRWQQRLLWHKDSPWTSRTLLRHKNSPRALLAHWTATPCAPCRTATSIASDRTATACTQHRRTATAIASDRTAAARTQHRRTATAIASDGTAAARTQHRRTATSIASDRTAPARRQSLTSWTLTSAWRSISTAGRIRPHWRHTKIAIGLLSASSCGTSRSLFISLSSTSRSLLATLSGISCSLLASTSRRTGTRANRTLALSSE